MANRVLLGQFAAGDYRVRISAPGQNVLSTTLTKNQILFDSELAGYGVVYKTGTFSLAASTTYSAQKLVSWTSIGYVPVVYMLVGASNARKAFIPMTFQLGIRADGIYATGTTGTAAQTVWYAVMTMRGA